MKGNNFFANNNLIHISNNDESEAIQNNSSKFNNQLNNSVKINSYKKICQGPITNSAMPYSKTNDFSNTQRESQVKKRIRCDGLENSCVSYIYSDLESENCSDRNILPANKKYSVNMADFSFVEFVPDQNVMGLLNKMKFLKEKSYKNCFVLAYDNLRQTVNQMKVERNKFLVVLYYLD